MQYGWNKSFLGYVLFDMCGLNMDLKASCFTKNVFWNVLAARLPLGNTITLCEPYGSIKNTKFYYYPSDLFLYGLNAILVTYIVNI